MITLIIASMFAAAGVDTAATAQRNAFSTCLKESLAKAKTDNVAAEGFDAFMRAQCAASEADLRRALVAIDMKNGTSRKQAAEYARLDVEGYFETTLERYQLEAAKAAPKPAAPTVPPQPTPAAAPQPQQ